MAGLHQCKVNRYGNDWMVAIGVTCLFGVTAQLAMGACSAPRDLSNDTRCGHNLARR
jgi:hypothetical protein